jgi:hypothetical protein
MISIGIGDATVLHEADYIFNDFTEIESDFIKELIKEKRIWNKEKGLLIIVFEQSGL